MKKIIIKSSALILTLALIGCSSNPSNQEIGTVGGAVAGGVVGNAIGDSTAATVGGAAVGALIGNQVGKNMDQNP